MAAKKKRERRSKTDVDTQGYVSDSFRWEDILKAIPPEKKPGASNIIPNPLDKEAP